MYEDFKSNVLDVFRKVFPQAEIKEQGGESWIEFILDGERYGVRFIESHIWEAMNLSCRFELMAADMLRKAVTHIATRVEQ